LAEKGKKGWEGVGDHHHHLAEVEENEEEDVA
jgi:hypothetical protein